MREPERIKRILSLLEQIWNRYPDTRFNQLISSLEYDFAKHNPQHKKEYLVATPMGEFVKGILFDKVQYNDLFNVEDDTFEQFLVDYLKGLK